MTVAVPFSFFSSSFLLLFSFFFSSSSIIQEIRKLAKLLFNFTTNDQVELQELFIMALAAEAGIACGSHDRQAMETVLLRLHKALTKELPSRIQPWSPAFIAASIAQGSLVCRVSGPTMAVELGRRLRVKIENRCPE